MFLIERKKDWKDFQNYKKENDKKATYRKQKRNNRYSINIK